MERAIKTSLVIFRFIYSYKCWTGWKLLKLGKGAYTHWKIGSALLSCHFLIPKWLLLTWCKISCFPSGGHLSLLTVILHISVCVTSTGAECNWTWQSAYTIQSTQKDISKTIFLEQNWIVIKLFEGFNLTFTGFPVYYNLIWGINFQFSVQGQIGWGIEQPGLVQGYFI